MSNSILSTENGRTAPFLALRYIILRKYSPGKVEYLWFFGKASGISHKALETECVSSIGDPEYYACGGGFYTLLVPDKLSPERGRSITYLTLEGDSSSFPLKPSFLGVAVEALTKSLEGSGVQVKLGAYPAHILTQPSEEDE